MQSKYFKSCEAKTHTASSSMCSTSEYCRILHSVEDEKNFIIMEKFRHHFHILCDLFPSLYSSHNNIINGKGWMSHKRWVLQLFTIADDAKNASCIKEQFFAFLLMLKRLQANGRCTAICNNNFLTFLCSTFIVRCMRTRAMVEQFRLKIIF